MMWEKLISLMTKISLSITKIESIDIHIGSVQVQITPLQYYSKTIDLYALLCDILLCSMILGIPHLIIKLSQELRLIYVMDQQESIVDLNIMWV